MSLQNHLLKKTGAILMVSAVIALGFPHLSLAGRIGNQPAPSLSNRPEQITTETDPMFYVAVSNDGKWVAYTSERKKFTDLWLRSADPSVIVLPRRLTADPGRESSPAFSPDGRFIAYTSENYDAKGDIFLLDLKDPRARPVRLTGRDTEDGAPSFSPDGKKLYFHQKGFDDPHRSIVSLDIDNKTDLHHKKLKPRKLPVDGDGAFPSISPNGLMLAFVSYRYDDAGDIFVLDLQTKKVRPATAGPYMDFFPSWSSDGKHIFFSRFAIDSNRDGKINAKDNAAIFKTGLSGEPSGPYPLTSARFSSFQPHVAGKKIFFLSDLGGTSNCWSLPIEGQIPIAKDAIDQMKLGEDLSRAIPFDPYLTLLAYYKVLERFPDRAPFGAAAAFEIGKIYQKLNLMTKAHLLFRIVIDHYPAIQPAAAFSLIELTTIDLRKELKNEKDETKKSSILNNGLRRLAKISMGHPPAVTGRSKLKSAGLLVNEGRGSENLLKAIHLLESVIQNNASLKAQVAEAMVLKADIYSQIGGLEKVYPIYLDVVKTYQAVDPWADVAVDRILNLSISESETKSLDDKLQLLRKIADENRLVTPLLSIGALNRIGDLLFEAGEGSRAKNAYQQVLEGFPILTSQTAAARLSLAEILYKEERFRQALKLYEAEISLRPDDDFIYRLARDGYIQKSLGGAEYLYRLGEISSARKIFKELIEYDDTIVEAHRGYIKSAAAQKDVKKVLNAYRNRMRERIDDPIALYAAALCLTYLDGKGPLIEAKQMLIRAINLHGQIEYFHQTLGYVLEVLETVHKTEGGLEIALESYKKAYFLNNHEDNPLNAANLLLNIGNTYFLLGQHAKAFHHFTKRLHSKQPFQNKSTEVLFYQRLGSSAFHVRESEATINAFTNAIALIDRRMQPMDASKQFDKIIRYIMDQVITPLLKGGVELAGRANIIAKSQSRIKKRLSELNRIHLPPPAPQWSAYNRGMKNLILEQEKLNRQVVLLLKDRKKVSKHTRVNPNGVDQRLSEIIRKIGEDLKFPGRLILLNAELLDRLGLAYQEADQWEKAIKTHDQLFSLNKRLNLLQNLARNKRSVAYSRYQLAETLAGEERRKQLKDAAMEFVEVIALVQKYGVPDKSKKEDRGLFNIDLQFSIDEIGATRAGHGFSEAQEKRLAEAFISRIQVELDDLIPAETAIKKQLAEYPIDGPVSDSDLHGVSLLYHRAGQLAMARGKLIDAFSSFQYAADLTLRMKNRVSTVTNIMNMAKVLSMIPAETNERQLFVRQLAVIDKKTTRLLDQSPIPFQKPIEAIYHNTMGVYALEESDGLGNNLEQTLFRIRGFETAGFHFNKGLNSLEHKKVTLDRKSLALLSTLHLNLAKVAVGFEEKKSAANHFNLALELSKRGMLPDLKWRAYAGLNRFEEALTTLESVNILRAGCRVDEILDTFGKMVDDLVLSNRIEEAFNLAERLSELERFNRFSPLINRIKKSEKALFRKIYSRLERIATLRGKISAADGEEKQYLQQRLAGEIELIESSTGKNREKLPDIVRFIPDKKTQEQVMILLGLAVEAENLADDIVFQNERDAKAKTGDDNPGEAITSPTRKAYEDLNQRYRALREEVISERPEDKPADIITFFGAEPFEAADVMALLPEKSKLIRLFKTNRFQDHQPVFIAFTVTPDDIQASHITSISKNAQDLAGPDDQLIYLAYERLDSILSDHLPVKKVDAFALSATHLIRSILNRKPFKRNLLSIPPFSGNLKGYDPITLSDLTTSKFSYEANGVHTLWLSVPVSFAYRVPTREGEHPNRFLAADGVEGQRIALTKLLNTFTNLSLALLSKASVADAYWIGHLFSIYGTPSVILPVNPAIDSSFSKAFLNVYASASALKAMRSATSILEIKNQWIQLGYAGMTSEEGLAFAKTHFANYVQEADKAYKTNLYSNALALFENALQIAENSAQFNRYLPPLLGYARESAYRTGNLKKTLKYAETLANLMTQKNPDTKAHGEALLRLGIIYSQFEQYEKAVPILEEALEIFSNLELGAYQISTRADLGVILENAMKYDRAMDHFQAAASLSKVLNKEALLAGQHLNIGRIYDLRLSQYAPAIQSYKKALLIYKGMERSSKISARIGQSLLDIGRSYRLLGNFKSADQHYAEAITIVRSGLDNVRLMTKIIIEQANNAWFQGKYQEAFHLQTKSYQLAKENNLALMQVISLNTAGLLWWTLGDNQKAMIELQKALSSAKALRVRDDEVATTLNNIGLIFREMGRHTEALQAFEDALAIDTRLKSRWAIAYDLRNQGLTYLLMGETEKAIPLFQKALRHAAAIGNRINEAKAYLGLGDAYSTIEKKADAANAYQKALELAQSMSLRETEWRSIFGMAKLLLSDNPEKAEQLLLEAVSVIESMRSDIKILQLKDRFLSNKLSVYETLCRLLADRGKIVESFEIAERSRSRNFIDLLGNQRLSLNRSIDQKLYDLQTLLRSRIEEQEVLLAQSIEKTERQIYEQTLVGLRNDFETLMLEIQAENPQLSALVSVGDFSAEKLIQKLEPDVALIAYYILEKEIFYWLIRPKGIKLFRIAVDRRDFSESILDYRRRIQNIEPLADESRVLFNTLLTPVMPYLKEVKKLGIIPHGPLHYLSFSTLSNSDDYLIDLFPIFYLPSASVLNYTIGKRFKEKNIRVLALGNPDLGDPAFDLPFSEQEIHSIKWNFPNVTVMTKERATEKWVVDNIAKFGIIHMASHGQFDPINPLFSAIKLTKGGGEDGNLEAAEIFGLKINADIVVLSACQTGLGRVTKGDDVIGLNRAFFYAGTHTIVSSLWRVSDVSTAVMMKEFYRQYMYHNKSESLRLATLHVKKRFPHPGYWGAFTLVGDYY